MTTHKNMKSISFDGGNTVYDILDDNAVHTSDVTSTYSSTGTNPVNGTAVASAISSKQDSNTAVTHTASTSVGSSTKGVYIASDGTATEMTYAVNKDVPSDAVFTDTTYSNFTGADSITGGVSGLVPAPSAGDESKYLKGDGTWATVSGGGTIDQTYDGTSTNAQSGVAIEGELTSNYQTKLVSGDNIKTINNESLLGSGNITISGGGSYTGGTGISIDTNNAINHSNSITAGTAGTSSATSGSTLSVPYVTYDAQGHITASGTHTHTVSGFSTTDTKYTAGSSNSTSKLFLVGATSQGTSATNAQAKTTYSNSAVYAQNGYLYATTPASTQNDTTVATTKFVKDQGYTTNTGTVTSVNNVSPTNGNVTLTASDVGAVSTDTKNTAGSTDTSSKIYLVGATSQAANPQTYSHDTAFVDTNGRLNSAAPASGANDTTVATTKWVKDQSYTSNTGTITGITMNGSSKGTSGVVDLGTVITSHQDISGKEDILKTVNVLSTSGTITLTDNSINSITPSAAVTFSLPTVSDNTKFHQILVQVKLSTVKTITLGTSYFFNKTAPDLSTTGVYNLVYEYDKANQYWVVGCIPKGSAS